MIDVIEFEFDSFCYRHVLMVRICWCVSYCDRNQYFDVDTHGYFEKFGNFYEYLNGNCNRFCDFFKQCHVTRYCDVNKFGNYYEFFSTVIFLHE